MAMDCAPAVPARVRNRTTSAKERRRGICMRDSREDYGGSASVMIWSGGPASLTCPGNSSGERKLSRIPPENHLPDPLQMRPHQFLRQLGIPHPQCTQDAEMFLVVFLPRSMDTKKHTLLAFQQAGEDFLHLHEHVVSGRDSDTPMERHIRLVQACIVLTSPARAQPSVFPSFELIFSPVHGGKRRRAEFYGDPCLHQI